MLLDEKGTTTILSSSSLISTITILQYVTLNSSQKETSVDALRAKKTWKLYGLSNQFTALVANNAEPPSVLQNK